MKSKAQVDLKDILAAYKDLNTLGLTIQQVATLLSYRSELEAIGITPAGLKTIYEAAKPLGGYTKVLQAVKGYSDLEALRDQVASLQTSKAALEDEVKKSTVKSKQLYEEMAMMQHAIGTYGKLQREGFDEKSRDELKRSSEKYGPPKGVLEAINRYAGLAELQQSISDLELRRSKLEAELKKLEADHVHLITSIEMSKTLLYEHKFSPSAIADICMAAKKYGQPFEVLKAIGAYGELKAMEAETKRLSTERDELKNRVAELDVQARNLKATAEDIRAIQVKALEAGKALGEVEEKIKRSKSMQIMVDLIERPTEVSANFDQLGNLSLAFTKGLLTYVELNKDRIQDSSVLLMKIRTLCEAFTEMARRGKS